MNSNPWEVSLTEYQSNAAQFASLMPKNGKIDGNTARAVLIKSNLQPQVLAQIWALSDTDRDGLLDEREFSIAMRLTRNCISGLPLPPSLPPSLMTVPAPSSYVQPGMPPMAPPMMHNSMGGMMMGGGGPLPMAPMQSSFPVYNTAPAGMLPPRPVPPIAAMTSSNVSNTTTSPGRQCGNWTIPHQAKLRYSQQFNQLDKQRLGFLSGQAARSAMGLSGLNTTALAHIWSLSDLNKDGRLSVEEFCIAMHLIDMLKNGFTLPDQTPPELASMCGISRSANNSPMLEPGAPPAQKSPAPKTFEDKRMDNLARGQAELDRRRQILQDEENRRRAEVEKKEREEAEKRERERQELERQREMERLAEMERQRALEEARLEEERKKEAERELARKEAERLRRIEIEKQQLRDMQNQKQQEAERVAQRQQRQKTLGFQLQALDEKAADTDNDITKARDRISEITREIEGMRDDRDKKMQRITELRNNNQLLSVNSQELAHQLLQLQGANKETARRREELEETQRRKENEKALLQNEKEQLEVAKQRAAVQKEIMNKKREEYDSSRKVLLTAREEYSKILQALLSLQQEARQKVSEHERALYSQRESQQQAARVLPAQSNEHPQAVGGEEGRVLPSITSTGTTKCRALYEFVARSDDELSFEPGDVVLVFESHTAEPGWKAGQIRDKVGWFPADFCEPIAAVSSAAMSQPIQNMPPNVTPSPSLDRIPEESTLKSPTSANNTQASALASAVICQCVAQFPWRARNEGDLSFAKGDPIQVLEQQEMKWRGRKMDGSTGWFPKSYVRLVQSGSNSTSTVTSVDQPTPVAGTPIGGNSQDSRQNSFSQQGMPASGSNHHMSQSHTQQSIASQHSHTAAKVSASASSHSVTAAGEWFVAMYDFDAVEPTDLPLKVGDQIFVIEQKDAWWRGQANGREGIFPANFVQKIETPSATAEPVILCRVRAVADFSATAANQLNLRIGDEISVREKSAAGWWEGELRRNDGHLAQGWFPGDYVVPIEGEGALSPVAVSAKALFDYVPTQPDELGFSAGQLIIIDDKSNAEWWTGHKADQPSVSGVFPASYVELR